MDKALKLLTFLLQLIFHWLYLIKHGTENAVSIMLRSEFQHSWGLSSVMLCIFALETSSAKSNLCLFVNNVKQNLGLKHMNIIQKEINEGENVQ